MSRVKVQGEPEDLTRKRDLRVVRDQRGDPDGDGATVRLAVSARRANPSDDTVVLDIAV